MKNSIYMLCLGLLFAHSLQPGNICCGVKDESSKKDDSSKKKKSGFKFAPLDPNKLRKLLPPADTMQNDAFLRDFTGFVEKGYDTLNSNELSTAVVDKARGLLAYAIDNMKTNAIETIADYDCWHHNLGMLVRLLNKYHGPTNLDRSGGDWNLVDSFYLLNSSVRTSLFSRERTNAISAWMDDANQGQLTPIDDMLPDAPTDISFSETTNDSHSPVRPYYRFTPSNHSLSNSVNGSVCSEQIENHPHAVNQS